MQEMITRIYYDVAEFYKIYESYWLKHMVSDEKKIMQSTVLCRNVYNIIEFDRIISTSVCIGWVMSEIWMYPPEKAF